MNNHETTGSSVDASAGAAGAQPCSAGSLLRDRLARLGFGEEQGAVSRLPHEEANDPCVYLWACLGSSETHLRISPRWAPVWLIFKGSLKRQARFWGADSYFEKPPFGVVFLWTHGVVVQGHRESREPPWSGSPICRHPLKEDTTPDGLRRWFLFPLTPKIGAKTPKNRRWNMSD